MERAHVPGGGGATRLILHKFDPLTPAPGGIDTCIRGIIKYSDRDERLLIVGVDGGNVEGRRIGRWERHDLYGRTIDFLPVASLDPGNQIRRVPHAVLIARGLVRYRRRIPAVRTLQTHRADLAALSWLVRSSEQDYFVHTQESGILGQDSDSFWRRAGSVHRLIEKRVATRATRVRVFNPTYADVVRKWNLNTKFSPTWWDPELIRPRDPEAPRLRRILWVGRLEQPKVPTLALEVVRELAKSWPDEDWTLTMVGGGNLSESLREYATELGLGDRVRFTGRLAPEGVMDEMAGASVLLMTSVAGYEGFPRVLVEGLASGLSSVVTPGADTGGVVHDGVNGFRVDPDARLFASAVREAVRLPVVASRASVDGLSAPAVVRELYRD